MDRFAYAYKGIQHSLFVLLLLSTSAQAEVLFAPAVFTTAAAQTTTQAQDQGAHSDQKKAVLQRTAQDHPQPVSSPRNQWISQPLKASESSAPLPPKLRF